MTRAAGRRDVDRADARAARAEQARPVARARADLDERAARGERRVQEEENEMASSWFREEILTATLLKPAHPSVASERRLYV